LILGLGGKLAGEAQINDFLGFAKQRQIDLSDLWIVTDGERLLWATVPIVSPGKTMLLFAPSQLVHADQPPAAAELIDQVCQRMSDRGIHLAQVLLDPQEHGVCQIYREQGFNDLAELIYLQGQAHKASRKPKWPAGVEALNYGDDTREWFAQAIAGSYDQSLDCPGLNGLRTIEDIMQGHRATGEFDPKYWTVLVERDVDGQRQALGVLLLSRVPRSDSAELVYLGLVPSARGRGLGDLLMQHAWGSVVADNARRLTLAVDSRNTPALALYYRHGMQRITSKAALLRDLRMSRGDQKITPLMAAAGPDKSTDLPTHYPHGQ
jgi:ribosomal protein S18 acetylase RimI-like enzyme